jgi:hypothetical protein
MEQNQEVMDQNAPNMAPDTMAPSTDTTTTPPAQ